MSSSLSCHQQKDNENVKRLRQLIKELPHFCGDFFHELEPRTSSRTRIAYAYDLKVFFDFLLKENPIISKLTVQDITLDYLDELCVLEYMEYLKYRFNDKSQEISNKERGIMKRSGLTQVTPFPLHKMMFFTTLSFTVCATVVLRNRS
ncbi:MAG: hypothetical protein QM657_08760 [Lacrimispora sp.]